MEQKQTAAQLIRKFINEINLIISKQSATEQLDLINTYTNNIAPLINKSKAKIANQLSNAVASVDTSTDTKTVTTPIDAFPSKPNNSNTQSNQTELVPKKPNVNKSFTPLSPIKTYSSIPPNQIS